MTNEVDLEQPAPTQGQAKPLDFEKVDALRKHMLLTVSSMAVLFGATRVTYYSWLKGNKPHKKNAERVRRVLRGMAHLAAQEEWPNPAVFVATQQERLTMLQEMLAELQQE